MKQAAPELSAGHAAIMRWFLIALAAGAAFIFAVGSFVMLREVPTVTVLSEFGIAVPNSRSYRDHILPPPLTRAGAAARWTAPAELLAVDGKPVPQTLSADQLAAMLGDANSVTLTLVPGRGAPARVALTRSPGNAFEPWGGWLTANLALLLQWVLQFIYLAIGFGASLLLIRRRPRDPVALLFVFQAIVFAATSSVGWRAGRALGVFEPLATFDTLANLAVLTLPFVFPDGRIGPPWRRALYAVLFGAYLLLGAGDLFGIEWSSAVGTALRAATTIGILASVPILYLKFRSIEDPVARRQLKAAMFGLFVSTLLAMAVDPLGELADTSQVPRVMLGAELSASLISTLSSIILALGYIVALLRYRLYDTERTIGRSILFSLLTIALLCVFTVAEKGAEEIGQVWFSGITGTVAGGLAAALAALMIGPLHHRLSHWVEKRFRGDLIALRDGLPPLVADLRETAQVEQLAEVILARVQPGVQAVRGALVVDGKVAGAFGMPLSEAKAGEADATLFPVRIPLEAEHSGVVGWLLLGPRPDGSQYPREERKALADVAGPIARALNIVLHRERAETERHWLYHSLDVRLTQIEMKLSPKN